MLHDNDDYICHYCKAGCNLSYSYHNSTECFTCDIIYHFDQWDDIPSSITLNKVIRGNKYVVWMNLKTKETHIFFGPDFPQDKMKQGINPILILNHILNITPTNAASKLATILTFQ